MSFRSVLGTIIIFFAIIGLLINFGLLGFGFLSCQTNFLVQILLGIDCSKFDELLLQATIGIIVGIIWVAIGFAIKGKE